MTSTKAWILVYQMGWGMNANSTHIAKKFYAALGVNGMAELQRFVGARVADLYGAVEKYEASGKSLDVGSDDSMSDLLYHVVGCGPAEFERCLADPTLLEARYKAGNYEESFAYCFLEPDPPRTEQDKEKAEATLADAMKTVLEQHQKVAEETDKLNIDIANLQKAYNVVQMDKKVLTE